MGLLNLLRAAFLMYLAANYSVRSQLILAPVYGSTPARVYHQALCSGAVLAGSFAPRFSWVSRKGQQILPALAFLIPTLQSYLFQYSSQIGNPAGPLVTELFTIAPLVLFSAAASATLVRSFAVRHDDRFPVQVAIPIGCLLIFNLIHTRPEGSTFFNINSPQVVTNFVLEFIFAAGYAVAIPKGFVWVLLVSPVVVHFVAMNVHMPFANTTARLNSTLQEINYSLVDRQEALTGYISVLDNTQLGFRAMRCDHSLLGGQWMRLPPGYKPRVSDPIYAVFTMLESVRLVEADDNGPAKSDMGSNALVIGLGIGTTPAALIQHGINTTIVEIDSVVYEFALQYFGFPRNHTAVIDNAATFVESARQQPKQYDYIVHDVFTGGVEPVELFTLEFMQGLYALLKDDGVVAINYAGDLSLPGAGLIVRTIKHVFPQCRIFRENDGVDRPDSNSEPLGFTNMVVFCKKSARSPLKFRVPNKGDYLGSKSRESYMYPQHEIDAKVFDAASSSGNEVLQFGKTDIIEAYHVQNAIGHWEIMRGVLPAKVWENF